MLRTRTYKKHNCIIVTFLCQQSVRTFVGEQVSCGVLLLFMLPQNTVTVEGVGRDEADVNLSCMRELLAQLCRESVAGRLMGMIELVIKRAGAREAVGGIGALEVPGGGSRIPFV